MTRSVEAAAPWWSVPARLEALSGRGAIAASAGLGAVAALGHAPFFIWPAYAAGIVGLVWLLDGAARRSSRAGAAMFARGWAFGFGHFLAGLYWIGSAFLQVEGGAVLMIPAVLALPAGLALFWGAAARVALILWTSGPKRIAAFALCFGLAELARSTVLTGFPWNIPGAIWPAGGAVSQMAALIGIHGLGALTLLAFAAPATLADPGRAGPAKSGVIRASFGRRALPALAAALGLGLAWGAGAQRLATGATEPAGPVVRVVDAGVSQSERWSAQGLNTTINRYFELTGDARESTANVVIWPEAALPGLPLLQSPELLEAVGEVLQDRVLITGTVRVDRTAAETKVFNSAVVLDGVAGSLRVGQIYDKNHLVPFGEYMPFWELYSDVPLAPLQNIGRGFTPGPRPTRMIVPGAPPVAPMICYEAIFSGFPPRGDERADWLVNVSIDSWYGKGTGPWQHANLSRYRAIEEGLPLARAAAGGVSGIFDAYGREIVATDLDGGAVQAPLPPPIQPPPYAQFGMLLTAAVLIFIGILRFAPVGAGRRLTS